MAEECDSQVTPGALHDLDELIEDFDDEDWGMYKYKGPAVLYFPTGFWCLWISSFEEECLTMVQGMGGCTGELQEETSPLSKNEILVHAYMKWLRPNGQIAVHNKFMKL